MDKKPRYSGRAYLLFYKEREEQQDESRERRSSFTMTGNAPTEECDTAKKSHVDVPDEQSRSKENTQRETPQERGTL